jgi:cell wall-associated NlpC family hydrolase
MPCDPARSRADAARILLCALVGTIAVLVLLPGALAATKHRPARPSTQHARLHRSASLRHARLQARRLRRARLHRLARRRRDLVVVSAWRAVGTPYRWGGSSPRSGFDCSGLTRWVYGHVGISLPHYSGAQWRYGRRVSRRGLLPGDLLFFSGLGHVGIYLGHGALIHAPRPGERVKFARLDGWLSSSFVGARRLLPA